MVQGYLLDSGMNERPVNVASVPHRSLFRYSGGKTWLVPRVRRWLSSMSQKPGYLVEPFLGGGIISLTAVAEDLVDAAIMVELDDEVAAVWKVVLGNEYKWLSEKIGDFDITEESVQKILSSHPKSTRDKAFRTIVKNRVNRGGILAPGAGTLRFGENGKGLNSRWYPATLQKRIEGIRKVRSRISFIEGDGLQVLSSHLNNTDAVFFIDPPYTVAGKRAGNRLYKHSRIDHELLFKIVSGLPGDFLMTYDNCSEVQRLADKYHFDTLPIAMKNAHNAELTELIIGKSLEWAK